MKGISVIVCCYNSASRIKDTLDHLAKQELNGIKAEVIVVNNNSSDDTAAIAASCWVSWNAAIPMRIIDEPTPGLSSARHTGIKNAVFDYVVFCDDDNWLSEQYLLTAFLIFESDSKIGALGGMGIPVYEIEPPATVRKHVAQYAVGPQAAASGDVTLSKGYLYGAGIAIRKSAYEYLIKKGFKFTLTGRIGQTLTSGEDFELCQAIILTGYTLYYDSTLTFKHYLTRNRLNENYLFRMNKGFGYSIAFLYPYIYLSADKGIKGKSYGYILLKQLYHTAMTAFMTGFGLLSFEQKLKWANDFSALKSLLVNAVTIQKLCGNLPSQPWIKKS